MYHEGKSRCYLRDTHFWSASGGSSGHCTGWCKWLPTTDAGSLVYATYETLWNRLRHQGQKGVSYIVIDEVRERTTYCDLCLKCIRDILKARQR